MLMKLLGFVRTYLMPVSVLVVLAILALTVGPRVGLKPPRNIVVFAALMVLAILICLVIWYVQRKRERQFESAIVQQAQQDMARASVARRGEMEALIARWKESIRLLREANLRGKNVLQKLPWFAVIGESGSGKTTLIKNSGLDFPIGDAKIRGIGGTKNCDWWFANEAIILDTAGRYAFEVQSAPDREEWERFLGLLKKTRKRCPISGLVVTVPADSLLRKTEDEVSAYAQHLRGKINDLMTRLEIVFPVYLVLTKVDLVEGFVGFFSRYPANRVREAVGRTFADVRPASCVATAGKTLDDLYDRLCSMSLGLMEEEDPGAPAQPYLMHPEEYHTLAGRLKVFIESLFRENIYMRNPIFRGLYLTSGTQEGRTITSAFSSAAAGLGIAPDVMTTTFAAEIPKRAYFVRDLLSRILVEDAKRELVRALSLGGKQQFVRALYRVLLPAGAIVLVLLIWAAGSWAGSRADWRQLASAVKDSRFTSPSSVRGSSVRDAVLDLSKIRDLHVSASARSGVLNLGLVRSDPEYAAFARAFCGAAENHVLRPVLARAKQNLEGGQTSARDFIEDLAAYAAYRRALTDPASVPAARLAGLVGPASANDKLGAQNVRTQLGELALSYAEFGGKESGGISFQTVAQRIRQIVTDLDRTDPKGQLRALVAEGAGAIRANASEQEISALWDRLRPIAYGAGGAGNIPPELVEQVDRDMETLPDARVALEALRALKPQVVAGLSSVQPDAVGGKLGAFVQSVRTPLAQAADVAVPSCGMISPDDPATITTAQEALQKFAADVGKAADTVRAGITSLNADLAPSEKIDAQATADLVRRGRMGQGFKGCTTGWFDPEGPLSPKLLSGGGGGGGGGSAHRAIGSRALQVRRSRAFGRWRRWGRSGGPAETPGALRPLPEAVESSRRTERPDRRPETEMAADRRLARRWVGQRSRRLAEGAREHPARHPRGWMEPRGHSGQDLERREPEIDRRQDQERSRWSRGADHRSRQLQPGRLREGAHENRRPPQDRARDAVQGGRPGEAQAGPCVVRCRLRRREPRARRASEHAQESAAGGHRQAGWRARRRRLLRHGAPSEAVRRGGEVPVQTLFRHRPRRLGFRGALWRPGKDVAAQGSGREPERGGS